ncbi:4858_t:CDS:10 [Funneliformis mosseae]|uniref:4858_t:CDS:1 n=1 Tax=Funneliformis mosseae TaxID=27381 RepID=A0A9N8VRQ2_FUNMO|nr:4858_t:CDS:10 [Funneliformis mosseae]
MFDASNSHEENGQEFQILRSESTINIDKLINEKIHYIAQNAGVKNIKKIVKNQILELDELVLNSGLEVAQIAEVLNVILTGKLDDIDTKRLIKVLLPRTKISNFLVIKVLGSLGNKILKYNIQALLLRWIIIVYNVIEDHSELLKFYGVIIHYMEYDTLRVDLQNRYGPEPHLLGLLTLYKAFFPNLVTIRIPPSKGALFKCSDVAWFQLFNQIQRKWNCDKSLDDTPLTRSLFLKSTPKRRKLDHIEVPKARTFNATQNSITLDEIMNVKLLASNIDKIDLPSQLASVLENRMLQHIVVCNPEKVTIARISYWLEQCLMELVYWNDNTVETKALFNSLLTKIVALTEFMKQNTFKHGMESNIKKRYLKLSNEFLTPLQKLHEKLSSNWKAKLIHCYTNLFTHWILHQEDNFGHTNQEGEIEDLENSFLKLSTEGDHSKVIQELINHINQLSLTSLESTNDDLEVQHAILSAFETIANLQLNHNWDMIIIPSSSIVYRSFFTSGMSLSRICGIVLQYKEAFDKFEKGSRRIRTRHNRNYINYFNSFVMDMCNCLWRNRPFNKEDKNAKGFQLDDDIIQKLQEIYSENWVFSYSITHLPFLSALSKSCVQNLEDSSPNITKRLASPVTQFSLKEAGGLQMTYTDYRVHFLKELHELGFIGIHDFLCQSLTSLSKLKKG